MSINSKLKKMFSICIFDNDSPSELKDCVRHARDLTDNVFFVDSSGDESIRSKANELGIHPIDLISIQSTMPSEWILFLKANEKLKVSSFEEASSLLNDKTCQGYFLFVNDNNIGTMLKNYQLIGNLGQYDQIGNRTYVVRTEIRLVRVNHANECLKSLIDHGMPMPFNFTKTVHALSIESISEEEARQDQKDQKEHDKRCLNGEIRYGPVQGEDVDELSSGFIGFRVLDKSYLSGFMESAHRGFGIDNMYLSMIEYLRKNGDFEGAKGLLEAWVDNRDGEELINIYTTGAAIYGELFLLDKAIAYYKKATEYIMDPLIYASIGKLYLIKGERENALKFLEKSIMLRPDPFNEQILSTIKNEQWKPLTLSLCMIAKDEERTIGQAITSMKNIADEIIVVDTGSNDKTKEIAGALGARVIEKQWNDDFSIARNIALKEAECDYAFVLDADEFIDVSDQVEFAFFKKCLLPDSRDVAFRVRIKLDENSQDLSELLLNKSMKLEPVEHQIRLFPRGNDISFTGAAFESVDYTIQQKGIKVADAPLFKITHQIENQKLRSERKIHAIVKSFSSIDNSSTALKGGLFFLREGDIEQAYQWFKKVRNEDPVLLSRIAGFYTSRNFHDQAEEIIKKALKDTPDSLDLNLALSKLYFKKEQYTEIHNVLSNWINADSADTDHESAADAFYYYGMALLEMGQVAGGIDFVAQALEKEPLNMMYKIGGLYALAKSDQWDEFFKISENIVHQEKIKIGFEIKGFLDVGRLILKIFRYFINAGKQDEAFMCQKILTYLIHTKMENAEETSKFMKLMEEANQTTYLKR